jgi:CheY-like chemotaxis protein
VSRIAEPALHRSLDLRHETGAAPPTVLIVEDDRQVRDRIVRVLRATGASVTAVADAEAALRFSETGSAIDVLVTDWALPGLDGLELARRLRSRHGSLAAVVVSGLDDAASACDRTGTVFVRKPFAAGDLVEAVGAARAHRPWRAPPSLRSGSRRPRPS